MENLILHFDEATLRYSDSPGVTVDASVGFGTGVEGLSYLDPATKLVGYFESVIRELQAAGWSVGHNLVAAPYDWRLAPDGLEKKPGALGAPPYFTRLRLLIEHMFKNSGGVPAHIVTHSMGGPVGLAFLQRQSSAWKEKYIASLTSFSPPFGGSVDTIKSIISGNNLGVPAVSQDIFWPLQSTCASGVWLLPVVEDDEFGWSNDEIILSDQKRVFSAANVSRAFELRGLDQASSFIAFGVQNLSLSQINFVPPGVPVNILRGTGVKTEVGYSYDVDFESFEENAPTKPPSSIKYDMEGDGTVPNRSLARAILWKEKQDQPVTLKSYSGASHYGILKNKGALEDMVKFLS